MSYENAPATKMLATHCAFCSRPLVDAQSVETGVGPICRKKHWVADKVPDEARIEGNKLIYQIARFQKGPMVVNALVRLAKLGFDHVVKRICKRLQSITITIKDGRIYLKTPWLGELFDSYRQECRAINGSQWENKKDGDSFPVTEKVAVYQLLMKLFPGRIVLGPKGPFIIKDN